MSTTMQSVFITTSDGASWTGRALCPVLPPHKTQIETSDGVKYFVTPTKTVSISPEGDETCVTMVWPSKPTMKDAVMDKTPGAYYQFNADGSVIYKTPEHTLSWSAPMPAIPISGKSLYGYYDSETDTFEEEEYISCRICGSNCAGGDYPDWAFCSRSCMVECSRDY
jgi:hypothetical protein